MGLPVEQVLPTVRHTTPLQAAAAQRGWGAQELADAVGVPDATATKWLAGTRTPLITHANQLAAALDRPLDQLFDLTPAQPQPQAPRTLTAREVLAVPATGQKDWQSDAACATPDADPEQWWPTGDDPALEARATCAGCPVIGDCRDAYLASPDSPDGRTAIWAGLPGGRLRAAARTPDGRARDPRAPDAAPGREHTRGGPTPDPAAPRRDRKANTQPADATRQRDLPASARAHRDLRASAASDGADPASGRARTADTGISP